MNTKTKTELSTFLYEYNLVIITGVNHYNTAISTKLDSDLAASIYLHHLSMANRIFKEICLDYYMKYERRLTSDYLALDDKYFNFSIFRLITINDYDLYYMNQAVSELIKSTLGY